MFNLKRKFIVLSLFFFIFGISSDSFAENSITNSRFEIRNGITYGATLANVKTVENANANVQHFETLDIDKDGIIESVSYKGQIAGYSGSQVFYYFEDKKDGKLLYFYYRLGAASEGNEKYASLLSSLTEKYGEPDLKNIAFSSTSHPLFVHKYNPYEKYSQWYVEYEDCYSIMTLYTENIFGNLCCFLKYDLYSKDEMGQLLVQYQNQFDAIEKQKESDL